MTGVIAVTGVTTVAMHGGSDMQMKTCLYTASLPAEVADSLLDLTEKKEEQALCSHLSSTSFLGGNRLFFFTQGLLIRCEGPSMRTDTL